MDKKILIAGIAVFFLTVGAGIYAQDFGKAEMVHFQVAVPAGTIKEPVVVKNAGQSITVTPLTINLVNRGFPKAILNRNIEGISTHGITNVGKKPVRVRMEMVNETVPVQWDVSANLAWDPETHTFTDPLMPGKSIQNLGMDWFFTIPPDQLYNPVIYDGGLRFSDADTGELLTFMPIRIVNGDPSANTMEAGCH
jgi:hypothetical protein